MGDQQLPGGEWTESIDNQFLMLAVTQGFTGLVAFLAVVAGTVGRLFRMAVQPMRAEDRGLVFAQLAIMTGLMTTIITVFSRRAGADVVFLIAGWVQAMNPVLAGAGNGDAVAPFKFQRVLT